MYEIILKLLNRILINVLIEVEYLFFVFFDFVIKLDG